MSNSSIWDDAKGRAQAVADFQILLARCATQASRKTCIMFWREHGLISDEDTTLLIQTYGLETA